MRRHAPLDWLQVSIISALVALAAGGCGRPASDSTVSGSDLATPVDPSYLQLLEWRSIGPSRGGRSVAVAGDPQRRPSFFTGSTGGGLWRTDDGGVSWRNVSDGFVKTGSVGAVAVADSNPQVIYLGMGEACFRNNVSHGDGVYRSTDGGTTWSHVGLAATRHIARIRVHPRNPDLVYVAALGDGFGPSPDRGLFRSRDGGKTWQRVLFRNDDTGIIDLVMDPANPQILYASFLELRRFPWGLRSAGPGSGLFKTADGGDTWTEITSTPGFPDGIKGRIGLALSPARPTRLWAIVDAEASTKGLYRSDNSGSNWTRVNQDDQLTGRSWYYHHVLADPKNPDVVYVLNEDLWRSTDAGVTFTSIAVPHTDLHDMWIDPSDPARMVLGTDGGGAVSYDGGRSWSSLLNQPSGEFYHVTTDNAFPYRVYGAQQDWGSISLPSRSDFGRITRSEWRVESGGEAGYIAVHSEDPNFVLGGDHHWLYALDHRTNQLRDVSPWPENQYGWGTRDLRYRFQWTYPVVASPHAAETFYATAQVVFRTTNRGQSWEVISPDLTLHDPATLERTPWYGSDTIGEYWGPVTRDSTGADWYATVFAFAESPVLKDLLWAGSDDGLIHLSRDGGRTWTNVTPPGLPRHTLISIIEPSPHDAATAYVAANRYRLQDRRPYLLKTTDYGKTWTTITQGIPDGDFARVIREDPRRRGLLYAGTEVGVHVSFDAGARWQSLRLNLPVVAVHDLAVKDGDLVAATHGRGFWILDQAALLAQLNNQVVRAPVHVFNPAPVVHSFGNAKLGDRGEAVGADWFDGRNPPAGVAISYYLKSAPDSTVRLTIRDAAGRVVHVAENTGPTARRLPANPGANRYVWNTRHPGPTVLAGTVWRRTPVGPRALPGTYMATLEADGHAVTAPLTILKDPRLLCSDADLAAQFEFLVAIRDKLQEAHDLVRRIREMRETADAAAKAASGTPRGAALADAATALRDRLYPIEERLTQYRARAEKGLTSNPSGIDNKLALLAAFAEQADARPTDQARQLLTELSASTKLLGADLERVRLSEWAPFVIGASPR